MNKGILRILGLGLVWTLLPLPGAIAAAPDAKPEYADLSEAMDDLNAAYRRLGRQVKNAGRNEDSLKLVATIRRAAEASTKLIPSLAAEMPEAERPKFIEGYQREMQRFLESIQELDTALRANDNRAAEKIVEAMKDHRNEAHKKYKKPD